MSFIQRRLTYFPLDQDVPPAATALQQGEDVTFTTDEGLRLGGWFVRSQESRRALTVLVFNGNAGDRSFRAPLAAGLSQAGFAVLLFDYRGYGRNPGVPSEKGLLADARAARLYATSRGDVDADHLVYFGESLGAAVAVSLASEHSPAALVLRSPYTSLADMARLHYPFLPAGPLLRDRFDSLAKIAELSCPLLIIAGNRDRIVPDLQSRQLYDRARGIKRFVMIQGADHNDLQLLAGDQLISEVRRFLKDVVPSEAHTEPASEG
jgi:fermentation-respiration switch protein FrsA (DUF1100 family)